MTKYTYDDLDRPVTSTAVERKPVAGNFVSRLTYDDMSNVVKAQTPSGATATNTYDTLGQLTQSADPNNVLTKLGYDYVGRQVRSSDGLGRSSVASYNKAGQLVSSKLLDAANNSLGTTQLSYDADGNLVSSTPASGNRPTTYTYDALGRLTQQVDPVTATESITIGYGYDAAGNRTRYTDGRGNSTIYTINTLGLPEKVIEPSTTAHPAAADRTWTASYDAAGNSSLLLSPGGVQRTRSYDAVGRLLKEEGTGAEASTATRELSYDLAGRLTSSSSIGGVNTYNYNDRGMLLRADGPSGTSTHGYDADGQLTQRIDAAGTANFTYLNGRPATVTDPVTRTIQTLGYNTAGQLSTIDYGSGRVRTVGYDAYGRMNSDTLKAGQTVVSSMTYGYNADNNITSKKTTGVAGAADNTYTYDQLGRLTSWTAGTKTTEYGWDAASNRTKAGTKLATYDERNRLINDGTSGYTYSARGNLLAKTTGATTEAFTFDAFDRMIKNSDRDFTYDALDRPVAAGTARMRYAGFSDEVVTDGTQSFGRSATDGLLSVGYETTKRLVLADRHGDIVGGFDPADTTLAAGLPDSRTYDPFGNSTAANGLKYRIGYQGDWTDPRSGDVNQGARWYNPESGTFNSRDTITHAAGSASSLPNLYAYAAGNPLTLNDPTGNSPWDPDDPGSWPQRCRMVPGDPPFEVCQYVSDPPPPPPVDGCKKNCDDGPIPGDTCKTNKKLCKPPIKDCRKTRTCPPPEECKRNCDEDRPPPPPKCDAECKRKKEEAERRRRTEEAREKQEDRAQTIPVVPPGIPSCGAKNPSLCPSNPTRPADNNGGYVDRSGSTGSNADRTYRETVTTLGSVVGETTESSQRSWLDSLAESGLPGSHLSPGEAQLAQLIRENPEVVHFGLDIGGLIPFVGEYLDVNNALLYASEGDELNAALSGSSAIPGIGWIPAGIKLGKKIPKLVKILGKCDNSFVPETRVLMADGTTKRIDQVRVGDVVMAADPQTGEKSAQRVTDVIVGDGPKQLVELHVRQKAALKLEVPGKLTATGNHPFHTANGQQWRDAEDLNAGASLTTYSDSDKVVVESSRPRTEVSRVFNLTVDRLHTYYVLAGNTAVLVHNCGGGAPRDAKGKFADRNGEPGRDGAADELTAWEHLELDGATVSRGETGVSAPGVGARKYDGTVQIDGQWYGIETKGGSAKRSPSQRAFDDWLNAPGNSVTTKDGRTLVGVFDVWIDR